MNNKNVHVYTVLDFPLGTLNMAWRLSALMSGILYREYLGVLYLFCGSGWNHRRFRWFSFCLSLRHIFIDLTQMETDVFLFVNGVR